MNSIKMTSGYNFEGYSIVDYLGVFSGECALGTGFLSSLNASIADLWGTTSNKYSLKLREAKQIAINALQQQAVDAGGNAIIGFDLDYTAFTADIMGVIANGTVVRIESQMDCSALDCVISKFNHSIFFRPEVMRVCMQGDNGAIALSILSSAAHDLTAVLADVTITSVFDISYTAQDVVFAEFTKNQKNGRLTSSWTQNTIPYRFCRTIKDVELVVKQYVDSGRTVCCSMSNAKETDHSIAHDEGLSYRALDNDHIISNFCNQAELLPASADILKLAIEYHRVYPEVVSELLIDQLGNDVKIECMYGNTKKDSLKRIRLFFEE